MPAPTCQAQGTTHDHQQARPKANPEKRFAAHRGATGPGPGIRWCSGRGSTTVEALGAHVAAGADQPRDEGGQSRITLCSTPSLRGDHRRGAGVLATKQHSSHTPAPGHGGTGCSGIVVPRRRPARHRPAVRGRGWPPWLDHGRSRRRRGLPTTAPPIDQPARPGSRSAG